MNVGEVIVKFGAEISGFTLGIAGVKSALGGLTNGLSEISFGLQNLGTSGTIGMDAIKQGVAGAAGGLMMLAAVAAAAAVAIGVALGVVAVKAAADFQQGMNRLVTGAGDVTDNMQKMGQSILGISTATGVLTGQLLPAMYQIISSGQRGAQAEETLRVAAMGAVAEQAKVVDVAKALTTAMTDYGTKQFNATQFMNGFTRATQLGRGSLEELSTSMGPILPLAKNIGISFADISAAMATMTNAGIPAAVSATGLRFLMQSLEVPTKKARDAMVALGLSSVAVGNELKTSLPGALEMIYHAALRAGPEGSVPFNRAVSDMIGGQRSLQAFLALTGTHFSTFSANARAVAQAMNESKTAILGWDTAQNNFNVRMDMAKAALQALAITVGTALLPVITQIVGQITPIISKFTEWVIQTNAVGNAVRAMTPFFQAMAAVITGAMPAVIAAFMALMGVITTVTTWLSRNALAMQALMVIARVLGAIIVGVLVVGLLFMAVSLAASATAILLIVGVVMGLVAAFRFLAPVFAAIGAAAKALYGVIAGAMMPVLQQLGAFIMAFLVPVLQQLGAFIMSVFIPMWQQLVAMWQSQMLPALQQLWAAIQKLQPILQLLGMALAVVAVIVVAVLAVAFGVLIAVIMGVIAGLSGLMAGVMMIFTGIVQVVTGVVQVLSGIVSFIVDLFTGHFEKLAADLGMIWQGIINIFLGAWNIIAGIFVAAFGLVIGLVMGFCQGIIMYFTTLYQALVGGSIIPDMVNGIITWFNNLISQGIALIGSFVSQVIAQMINLAAQAIAAAVSMATGFLAQLSAMVSGAISKAAEIVSGVASGLAGLVSVAASAGVSMMNALIGGIGSMMGALWGQMSSVASTIANFLPHSPAKEGPLRELDAFGPALTSGIASGIVKGTPAVRAAVNMMVQPLAGQMTKPVGTGTLPPSRLATQDTRPIIIQIDGRDLMRAMGPAFADEIRIQMGGRK